MATFQSFEEIEAWRRGRALTQEIRKVCKRENVKRDFAWIDQITRASRSITANIAEGFESLTPPEFITFLGYAKRSCGEVRSHLYDALDEEYISKEEFLILANETKEICKMIAGLMHYLQSLNQKQRRTLKNQNPELTTKN
jgi:four helix bundle protein